MIEQVDSHIATRLGKVLFAGAAMKVYAYLPEIEKGQTVYPCYGFARRSVLEDPEKARPNCELFAAQVTQVTVDVPHDMGGGTESGPDTYVWKPYPTPVILVYEIQAHDTKKTNADRLVEGLFQAFPTGYTPKINGQALYFEMSKPIDHDALEIPLFMKSCTLTVHDVLIDRYESATYRSLQTVDFDVTA